MHNLQDGSDLKNYREGLGMTQQEFADYIGVARSYVSLIEAGMKPMTDRLRRRIDAVAAKNVTATGNTGQVAIHSPGALLVSDGPNSHRTRLEDMVARVIRQALQESTNARAKADERIAIELATIKERLADVQSLMLRMLAGCTDKGIGR